MSDRAIRFKTETEVIMYVTGKVRLTCIECSRASDQDIRFLLYGRGNVLLIIVGKEAPNTAPDEL